MVCECGHPEEEHTEVGIDPARGCFGTSGLHTKIGAPIVWGACSCEALKVWYDDDAPVLDTA